MPSRTTLTRAFLLALSLPMLCAARPIRVIHGTVKDSASGRPLANVRVLTAPLRDGLHRR